MNHNLVYHQNKTTPKSPKNKVTTPKSIGVPLLHTHDNTHYNPICSQKKCKYIPRVEATSLSQRQHRGTAEAAQRYSRGSTEVQQRQHRGTAEAAQRYSRGSTEAQQTQHRSRQQRPTLELKTMHATCIFHCSHKPRTFSLFSQATYFYYTGEL